MSPDDSHVESFAISFTVVFFEKSFASVNASGGSGFVHLQLNQLVYEHKKPPEEIQRAHRPSLLEKA